MAGEATTVGGATTVEVIVDSVQDLPPELSLEAHSLLQPTTIMALDTPLADTHHTRRAIIKHTIIFFVFARVRAVLQFSK
jgi:hypothetical protein